MFKYIEYIAKNTFFSSFLFLFIIILSHLNIFHNQFVMDDFDFIVNWPLIQDLHNSPKFFIGYIPPAGQEGIYSPLKTFFHAVFYHWFGLNPLGYHIVSLIIHFAGTFFVYRLSFLLSQDPLVALLSGIFFCLHPVQVEAITYMTASVDMIGMVSLLASFYFYIRSENFKNINYVFSVLFALSAVFAHELALVLPLLFLWYTICFPSRQRKMFQLIPFFAIVGAYAVIKWLVLGSITRGNYLYDSFYLTGLVAIKAFAKYVFLVLWPQTLTHDHVISSGIFSFDQEDFDKYAVLSQSIFDPQVILSLVILVGIFYCAYKCWQKEPIVPFCLGWFFISLLPGANIIPSSVYFAERYLYCALLGFSLLMAFFITKFCANKKNVLGVRYQFLAICLIAVIFSGYFLRTWVRNYDWHDDISLFKSAVQNNPQSVLLKIDLGVKYNSYNQPEQAIGSFQKALEIRPKDPVIYFSMAESYIQLRQNQQALESLKKAIELNPEYSEAFYNLAGLYAHMGYTDQAWRTVRSSLELYRKQKRYDEADDLEEAFKSYFGKLH